MSYRFYHKPRKELLVKTRKHKTLLGYMVFVFKDYHICPFYIHNKNKNSKEYKEAYQRMLKWAIKQCQEVYRHDLASLKEKQYARTKI